jgi:choline dehydrogenase-like flavoprotein
MRARFGVGADWPLSYADLVPYYALAEREIGVSAEVVDQAYAGVWFEPGYHYPMHRIPPSWLDRWIAANVAGMVVDGDPARPVNVVSIPQARNGIANADHDHGRGYQPVGAVGNPAIGQRCQGNSNCLPICPVQARYSARKTLARLPDCVHLLPKAVVSRLDVDPESGRITGLAAKVWRDPETPDHRDVRVEAGIFVAAAHAIENAVLLLASSIADRSDQLGRNLMDHPAILSWGLAPAAIGAFRGPGLTSTIPTFRSGRARAERAGFVLEIGNWGWSWPKDEPTDMVSRAVDDSNLFGAGLRRRVVDVLPRQVRFDMMTEQLPAANNRVTIDRAWRDRLGSHRPVLSYSVDAYSQAGMVRARGFARDLFRRLGVEDFTSFDASDPGYFQAHGQGYAWAGVGHLGGTHRMGKAPADSVVDHRQRAWNHDNLYIVGCGSFPTMGTSNPTLTMSALSFRTAEYIDRDLAAAAP